MSSCHTLSAPYDGFTQNEAKKLKADLDSHLGEILYGVFEVKVLPNKQLSDSFLGETKKKYRINKIIDSLKEDADNEFISALPIVIYAGITKTVSKTGEFLDQA